METLAFQAQGSIYWVIVGEMVIYIGIGDSVVGEHNHHMQNTHTKESHAICLYLTIEEIDSRG